MDVNLRYRPFLGSVLGLELAKHHPGWLHAYIGVGR